MVYNSLILPYLTYCNLIWSNAFESRLNKLVVLQKKAIRIIGKAEYLAHADLLFKQFWLLQINDIGQQQISVFVYKFIRKELPPNFANFFFPTADIHSHFTRHSSGFHISYARTNVRQKSLEIIGPHIWNKFPSDITQSRSLPMLKRKLNATCYHFTNCSGLLVYILVISKFLCLMLYYICT